jgi:hypothetical protein
MIYVYIKLYFAINFSPMKSKFPDKQNCTNYLFNRFCGNLKSLLILTS